MNAGLDLAYIKRVIKTACSPIEEDGVVTRILDADDPNEAELFQRFRYKYWVEQFRIVPRPSWSEQLEYDKYDEHAIHFGAFDLKKNLIGYSRLILPGKHGLQVHNAYEELVHPRVNADKIDISKCVESSRLTAVPEITKKRRHVARMLYKAKYHFTKRSGFKYWYLVAEKKMIRALWLFQRYPFEIVGPGKEYLAAVRYPAIMSMDKLDELLLKERPEHYYWMNDGLEHCPVNEPRVDAHCVITDILREGS